MRRDFAMPDHPMHLRQTRRAAARPFARSLVRPFAAAWLIAAMSASFASTARATDYIIEVVLFEHVVEDDGSLGSLWFPRIGPTLGLGSDSATDAGFIPVDSNLTLDENARSIAGSRRYRVLRHFAWRQPGLAEADAMAIRISLGGTFDLWLPEDITPYDEFIPATAEPRPDRPRDVRSTTLNGSIKVRLGRFLHLETLLVYTDEATGKSFRLSQSRKMRSRELHYIDNPRFGLLTRIVPVEDS